MHKHGVGAQGIERSSMSRMNVAIDIAMSTFPIMQPAVTIGGCVVNKVKGFGSRKQKISI